MPAIFGLGYDRSAVVWFLGFLGNVFIVDASVGDFSQSMGLIWAFVGLVAITSETMFQKKFSNRIPLSINNFYQAEVAALFPLIVVSSIEPVLLSISTFFILATGWQITAV